MEKQQSRLFNCCQSWLLFKQYGADEQLADVNPNDATIQKYFEEQSKGWIEQGDERQPKVDVQLELSRLNFCKSLDESQWFVKMAF